MDAGSSHGVATGALFSIYPSADFNGNDVPLAGMMATVVRAYTTELQDLYTGSAWTTLPSPCFAFQTRLDEAAALRLHIAHTWTPTPALNALQWETARTDYPVTLFRDAAGADLCARERDGRVELTIGDSVTERALGLALQSTVYPQAERIHRVLRAASQFFRHLRRSPKNHQLGGRIEVEVHEMRRNPRELDSLLRALYLPVGPNMLRSVCGELVLDVSEPDQTKAYGMTLTSRFEIALHIWAFYFDCSDLSISERFWTSFANELVSLMSVSGVFPAGCARIQG